MSLSPEQEKVALDNCEQEPVHIPGYVQPFGAILVFDQKTENLLGHSDNVASIIHLGGSPDERVLKHVVGRECAHEIRGALGLDTIERQRERLTTRYFGDTKCDVSLFSQNGRFVVELEPAETSERFGTALGRVRTMLSATNAAETTQELLEQGAKSLRYATGYDRVMAYRFLENGDGEVSAEAVGPGIGSFLGLRYPAYDIPPQVRRIALKSPVRMIANITAQSAELVMFEPTADPVDLTLSHLRGVSPIHVEYLQNMGVRATLTIAMICHGELWGLFACHHYQPWKLSADTRSVCELFGQFFSLNLQQQLEKDLLVSRRKAQSSQAALRDEKLVGVGLIDAFDTIAELVPEIVRCDGMAVVTGEVVICSGDTPSERVIREIIHLSDEELHCIDSLASVETPSDVDRPSPVGGAMVIEIIGDRKSNLVLFRNEIIHEVRWGGMPKKDIEFGPNGPRLHPRASFDEYCEQIHGKCPPWTTNDLAAATELRIVLLETLLRMNNESAEFRVRQQRQKDLLIAELNHRVKNILALVQSVARQTKDSTTSLDQYAVSLEKRIAALATAHDLVGASGTQWASLRRLLKNELQPYMNRLTGDIVLAGPDMSLRSDVAPIVALVIHELVSNAAKHGALSESHGRVVAHWQEDAGGLAVYWREQGGPLVKEPVRTGFGKSLIDRAIPYECKGEVRQRFAPGGVEVDIWLPKEAVKQIAEVSADKSEPHVEVALEDSENCGRALVVEDNLLIASELQRILGSLGYGPVEAVPSVREALQYASEFDYRLAVLDINLGEETSFEAAKSLRDLQVPIVFSTGYDTEMDLPEELRGLPIPPKPINETKLRQAVARLE